MPRAKVEFSKYDLQYAMIGSFKKNYPDYLYDFKCIYHNLLDFFGDNCTDQINEIRSRTQVLDSLNIVPTENNRTYIITNYDSVVFTMVNMDNAVIDNLIDVYDIPVIHYLNEEQPEKLFGGYVSSLYIFKEDKMCLKRRISPVLLAKLMAVFKNENLVNYQGARDSYYGKPRRESKKSLGM